MKIGAQPLPKQSYESDLKIQGSVGDISMIDVQNHMEATTNLVQEVALGMHKKLYTMLFFPYWNLPTPKHT